MRSRAIHRWNSKTAFTLASFFCLFLFGLFDSLKGSTLSTLLKDLNLNYSLGGTIILGQYSGYFLSTFITGIFIDQLGHRATLILCAASMILGTAGYASVSTLPFLFLFILFIGFGLGTLELCGSNIITTYYPEKKGRYLNMLSAMSGIGAILSPFLGRPPAPCRALLEICILYRADIADTDRTLLYILTGSRTSEYG